MDLRYYILIIDANLPIVDKKHFLKILEDFLVVYATCQGGHCTALCEDTVDLKLFNLYDTNNLIRYDDIVYIVKQGELPPLFEVLKNDDGHILVDNRNKWSL